MVHNISERKMIKQMIILNTNMNISMRTAASNTEIKKTFLEIYEKELKERYNPPTILPIPDGAPTNVPLIVMKSLSNHTQLVLTKSSISIGTSYDEVFNSSWDKCERHLLEKVKDVFLFIEALKSIKINFIGLVAQIIKDEYDDASKYIFDNLLKFASTQSVYYTECKLTYVLKDKYYINLDIQNVRLFDGKPLISSTDFEPFISEGFVQNKLVVSIDINNRYSYNFKKSENISDISNVDEIVSYTRQIVENLDDIVKGDVKIED
jgi:hypothetical protein